MTTHSVIKPLPKKFPCGSSKLITLSYLLVASLSFQTQAQQDVDIVRVNTELVILNLTVTDKAGKYVSNLGPADFKIYEDGKEVQAEAIKGFGFQDTPFASVVLLDTSGSMESRLSLARSAAIRFLDGLRPDDVASVYKFDYKVDQLQDFSSTRDLAPLAFALKARGMTTLNDAIIQAASALAARPERRKAIVVLSDGIDTYSKASGSKALDSALAVGASIYAVDMSAVEDGGLGNQQSAMVLRQFAEKSGGRFIATPGGPALREAFASIAEELGHQYTMAYKPSNPARDGRWRTIDVRLSRNELTVRTRKGYRAAKG